MAGHGLWIKLLVLALALLAVHEAHAEFECSGVHLDIVPENVADVQNCSELVFGEIEVADNVTALDLSNLLTANLLTIQAHSLTSLLVPNLVTAQSVYLNHVTAGLNVEFAALHNVSMLKLHQVVFPSVSFPSLVNVTSELIIIECSGHIDDQPFAALRQTQSLIFAGEEAPVSGLNQDSTENTHLTESATKLRVSGFNQHLTVESIEFEGLVNVLVDGFNGDIECKQVMVRYSTNATLSGFNGRIISVVMGFLSSSDVVVSGFSGDVKSELIAIQSADGLDVTGFQGLVEVSVGIQFWEISNLTLAKGAFGSIKFVPIAEDNYSYYDSSAMGFMNVYFRAPTILDSNFNLAPDSAVTHVDMLAIGEAFENLVGVRNCFNGVVTASSVEIGVLPDLLFMEHSFKNLLSIESLTVEFTGLETIDISSFAMLQNVTSIEIAYNEYLQSIDGLLNVPVVLGYIDIHSNTLLHSLGGLCGLRPQSFHDVEISVHNNTALCCADLRHIFDAELFGNSTVMLTDCNNEPTCSTGFKCECASFGDDLCPNNGFCTAIRHGLQCLSCEDHEVFDNSTATCKECPANSLPKRTTCETCDLACQNQGKCSFGKDGQYCACPAGFGGSLCQNKQTFDVVTETKQSANVTKKRTNFAVNKPFVVNTLVAKPAGVTIVDVDLLQVTVRPAGVVLYEPVLNGEDKAGQPTAEGVASALAFAYDAASRNLQVSFTPLPSLLGASRSAAITVEVEFLLSYTVDGPVPVPVSVSKKLVLLRSSVPVVQSGEISTTTIRVEQSVTLFASEEEADRAQEEADKLPAEDSSDSLSDGAIAGIVVGSVLGASLLIGLGVFFLRRSSTSKTSSSSGMEMSARA